MDGALGKIAINNLRSPRQLIQLDSNVKQLGPSQSVHSDVQPQLSSVSVMTLLNLIEAIYEHIISIDELYRQWKSTSNSLPISDQDMQAAWNKTYTSHIFSIWKCFSASSIKSAPPPSFVSQFLTHQKGRACIARLVQFFPPSQLSLLFSTTVHSNHM